ncbi:RodZ domain-containing protein [Thiosocius teredinicola]|uniref:RodZ domain-containing protein n=1 Tax=Thiosocius teredinicola TaxID=1973002 RepID=UPI000990CD27
MSAVIPEQTNNNVTEFYSPGPGERLRAARLSKGIDLAKIASELHLTSSVVEALEADKFDEVGARVFVRGYLRNYARFVDVPVESVMRQFDEKWPDDSAKQAMVKHASPRLPADGGPSRGLAGAVTWLLLITLIALFLVWWRGYLDDIVPGSASTGDTATEEAAADGILPLNDGTVEGGLMQQDDPSMADGSLRLPAPSPEVPLDSSAAEPVDSANEAAGELSLPAAPPSSATDAAESATGTALADSQAPVAPAAPEVVMTFNAPCWVDVRDSDRQFKLFGEMPKGTRKVLGGEPPYKIVIGNARAVTISVNGVPVDLAPYAKGNVARFTLEP